MLYFEIYWLYVDMNEYLDQVTCSYGIQFAEFGKDLAGM